MLYNVALCKVRFWRATFPLASPPSSPARGRAVGQPRSGRLHGLPTAAPRPPVFPKPHPEDLAKPDNRTNLRSLRAVTLFASKKSVPRQPFTTCKQVLRGKPLSRNGGKSPCRSTGKANIQIVVRLCRAPASNQPPCKKLSALQNNHHRSSQNKPGQGSRTATLRRLRSLPTAAPRRQPYINSNSQADAKSDYRIRSTNINTCPSKKRP